MNAGKDIMDGQEDGWEEGHEKGHTESLKDAITALKGIVDSAAIASDSRCL